MCSIIGTTRKIHNLAQVNYFEGRRGPDCTKVLTHGKFTLVHNLLSITGVVTPQPFVSGDIAILFNGEIYNYREFGNFNSDGETLIPLYREYGFDFTKKLDGEFALLLVDTEKGVFLVSTDVFGTKPLWIAFQGDDVGVASYPSALRRLSFNNPARVPPNTTRVYSMTTNEILSETPLVTFDVRQHKIGYEDFIGAFEKAIRKRSEGLEKKIFLGLSSGYDSGAIACELTKQSVDFKVFSIRGNENVQVVDARLKSHSHTEVFDLSYSDFLISKNYLKRFSEEMYMDILKEEGRGGYVSDNTGAVGLSEICRRARKDDYKVLFSGQGADEIFSDYGFNGVKYAKHSAFGGKFPDDLNTVFPWRNFFGGVQRAYLDKEEVVAGSYGIETRYPFLDSALVQEFLWLTPELKNAHYKAPLYEYLKKNAYPMEEHKKIGFTPDAYSRAEKLNLKTLLYRAYWKLLWMFRRIRVNIIL